VEASTIVVPGEVALEPVPDPTIEFRADLLKLRGKVRLAEAEVEEARVSGRPELTVQLLRSPWGPERASFAGRVQLSWALLDNGRSRHEVKAARREVDAVQEELKEARSRADLEVRLTREALEARQRAVDSAAGILTRTRELVAKAQRGYAEGFGTQVDVLEAVRALREVEHEFAEAQHARTREIIAQYRATGILLKGIR